MEAYKRIVQNILDNGVVKENRTGEDALTIAGAIFEHDMSEGFPILTTKKTFFRGAIVETEFFLKGLTNKQWLIDRKVHIWDNWCNPSLVPYGHDDDTRKRMKEEYDLGPIYGRQWRAFGGEYNGCYSLSKGGIDQLQNVLDKLENDPSDRRMIVSAWNPCDLHLMALPPCHLMFQVTVIGDKLNLLWTQRSVDVPLGLPFNIIGYATILELIARHSGYKPGKLVGFLADTHIYMNQIEPIKEQMNRDPLKLPSIEFGHVRNLHDWKAEETIIRDYKSHPKIDFPLSI